MACKTCNEQKYDSSEQPIFYEVPANDGEFFIEQNGGTWSIITPENIQLTNTFQNPSFELNAAAWVGGVRTNAEAFEGVYSLAFTTQAQFNSPWGATNIPRCVSAMVKGCCGATLRIGIRDTTRWKFHKDFELTGCWQQVYFCQAIYNPGFLPDFLTFEVIAGSCSTIYLDLVTVVDNASDPITPFSGDSDNSYWSGTSHASASVSNSGSRAHGARSYLSDYEFKTIAYTGHMIPTINLQTTPFARRNGSTQQRARVNSRAITISGEICACNWPDLSQLQTALIDAMNIDLSGNCNDSTAFTIMYECVNYCGDLQGKQLLLDVVYTSGLEGVRSKPFCERHTLNLTAYSDPFFRENRKYCVEVTPGVPFTINNPGTSHTYVELIGRNRGTMTLTSLVNSTTGKQVLFGSAGAGYTLPYANSEVVFRNDPDNVSLVLKSANNISPVNEEIYVFGNSSPTKLLLAKGSNTLTLNGAMTGANSSFMLCFRPRYLSATSACDSCE